MYDSSIFIAEEKYLMDKHALFRLYYSEVNINNILSYDIDKYKI